MNFFRFVSTMAFQACHYGQYLVLCNMNNSFSDIKNLIFDIRK